MAPPNPVAVTIPANNYGQISATANAAFLQRVEIQATDFTGVFTGTGESVSMKLPSGSISLSVPPNSSPRNCTLYFQYSKSSGQWQNAVVNNPVVVINYPLTTITVTSEDANDHDNNDTIVTIECVAGNGPKTTSVLAEEIQAKSEAGMTLRSYSDLLLTVALAGRAVAPMSQ